jgi:hypothetical protein
MRFSVTSPLTVTKNRAQSSESKRKAPVSSSYSRQPALHMSQAAPELQRFERGAACGVADASRTPASSPALKLSGLGVDAAEDALLRRCCAARRWAAWSCSGALTHSVPRPGIIGRLAACTCGVKSDSPKSPRHRLGKRMAAERLSPEPPEPLLPKLDGPRTAPRVA